MTFVFTTRTIVVRQKDVFASKLAPVMSCDASPGFKCEELVPYRRPDFNCAK